MESEPVEPRDSYEDCTGESAEDADTWVDRITGKRRPKPSGNHGGWSLTQIKRATALYRLMRDHDGFKFGDNGFPLMTQDLAPFVAVTDELFGERLRELATMHEIEDAYGYSSIPDEDESAASQVRAAEREAKRYLEMYNARCAQVGQYSKRIDELAAERDALQRIVDGRAAIAEAEPAFAAVERSLEQCG